MFKLVDSLIFSGAVGLFFIGVHQLFVFSEARGVQDGVLASYWIFMVVAALLMWFKFRKDKEKKKTTPDNITVKSNQKVKK